jgi:uncharacterized protein YoaH (UPF0181 family)
MRLRLAVTEETPSPLAEANDQASFKAVLPEAERQRLDTLTGGFDFVGEQNGMRLFVAQKARIELRMGPLVQRSQAQRDEQIRALLSLGVSSTQNLHIVSDEQGQSHSAWPLRIVHATVQSTDTWQGGETLHRFLASYRFFEHEGDALMQVGDERLWQTHRNELLALLRSGWPQFAPLHTIAVLSELWQ